MPRKKQATNMPTDDGGQEPPSAVKETDGQTPGPPTLRAKKRDVFAKADVAVLPDGRVQSTITGIKEEHDELSYKCSQSKVAKFVLNDIAPEIK